MWSFQARKEFWVDVYTLSLSCVTALEERCGIFPERLLGRSGAITASAANKRFHKGTNTCCSGELTGTSCLEVPTTFASAMVQSTSSPLIPVHQKFTDRIELN